METFKLQLHPRANIDARCLDSWIQLAIKSSIKELALELSCNFPCALLSSETGWSVETLRFFSCAFRPTETFGCLRRLTHVFLHPILVNDEELGHLLSNCFALEKLEILSCNEIFHLEIPSTLSKLSVLRVLGCKVLQAIEINAPKLSTFHYGGAPVQNCFGNFMICYARTKLPFIAPNVVSLTLSSHTETVNTPMVPGKFLHLKYLDILLSGKMIFSPSYDFFSLISFISGSPAFESFVLRLKQDGLRHDSIVGESDGDPEDIRKVDCPHDHLKTVTITGFCSSKSLVELTIHILENTCSLKCLTLDTTRDNESSFPMIDICLTMSKEALKEAQRSLKAIRRYIVGKVPLNVCLKVLEPCKRCQPDII
ncbi:hypothetical protein HU200_062927 [Digitaria exilis]|uniref:At1g61320/AtMIF1 LRR domain-containing protein n=1 Tax=Digitaria exilis TaxID=1010633 RepID=A0A835A633_9POAL|nr:hypothetical protein HU200_062927 [Digitaria exilis]